MRVMVVSTVKMFRVDLIKRTPVKGGKGKSKRDIVLGTKERIQQESARTVQ